MKPACPLPQKMYFSSSDIYISNYTPSRGISDNSGARLTLRAKRVDFFRDIWNAEEEVVFKCSTLVNVDHEHRIHRWKPTPLEGKALLWVCVQPKLTLFFSF